jgi:hypothetical protein
MLRFLTKVPALFVNLFNAAKRAWKKLAPVVQQAIIHGSAIISYINKYLLASPPGIVQALLARYPALTIDNIRTGLNKVAMALNIAKDINSDDLDTLILNIQGYLASHKSEDKTQNKFWALISHTAATVISVFLAPVETKVGSVVSLMEYGYHEFVKEAA